VWSGCPLEPDVLLRLARQPPGDTGSLADVPGVGPALAARLGGTILRALASGGVVAPNSDDDPRLAAMITWRAGVAREMGVPPFMVVGDAVLRDIAAARPESRLDLARIHGVGPRLLAKFADDLLRLSTGVKGETPSLRETGSPASAQKNAVPSQDIPASLTKLRESQAARDTVLGGSGEEASTRDCVLLSRGEAPPAA
jgi:hypothetical protein